MCVAIYKPAGTEIPREDLEACFEQNDDGAGFAIVCQGKKKPEPFIHVSKGFFKFKDFWKAWNGLPSPTKNYDALIHFRISTHGGISRDNCHPFLIETPKWQYAVVHNGVFHDMTKFATNNKSDTRLFVERVLTPLATKYEGWFENDAVADYIDNTIGYNKLVVLRSDGKARIFNEKSGDWIDYDKKNDTVMPVWFSNTYWKRQKAHGGKRHLIVTPSGDGEDADPINWDEAWGPQPTEETPKKEETVEAPKSALAVVHSDQIDLGESVAVTAPQISEEQARKANLPLWAFNFFPSKTFVGYALRHTAARRLMSDTPDQPGDSVYDGCTEARLGRLFRPQVGKMFRDGFEVEIKRLQEDDLFIQGFVDFYDTKKREIPDPAKMSIYMAGYNWAIHLESLQDRSAAAYDATLTKKHGEKVTHRLCKSGGTAQEACESCRNPKENVVSDADLNEQIRQAEAADDPGSAILAQLRADVGPKRQHGTE